MKSGGALNLMKSLGRIDRLVKSSKESKEATATGGVSEAIERKEQEGTNYSSPDPLDKIPLKLRARYMRTKWPAQDRPEYATAPPSSRNIGHTLWRRYPNGSLDFRYAFQFIVEALRRFKEAPVINEVDALAISSVYPNIRFDNLPKEIVKIKAYLTPDEIKQLKEAVKQNVTDQVIRDIVDSGGA